jgi:putative acetyltransferase
MLRIEDVTTSGPQLDLIRTLFSEYASELNVDLCFQKFDEELDKPLKKYGPPAGALLLAFWNDQPAGCIALQEIRQGEVCEMKRLYTRPPFRKFGIGEELVKRLLTTARTLGYRKMVLDTLEKLQPAIKLYKRHGFVNISAYYFNPLPGVVYMEKEL